MWDIRTFSMFDLCECSYFIHSIDFTESSHFRDALKRMDHYINDSDDMTIDILVFIAMVSMYESMHGFEEPEIDVKKYIRAGLKRLQDYRCKCYD